MKFSTLFCFKKTLPGPHMNRLKRFGEFFSFWKDIRKKCVSAPRGHHVRHVVDCADTDSNFLLLKIKTYDKSKIKIFNTFHKLRVSVVVNYVDTCRHIYLLTMRTPCGSVVIDYADTC